jgi:hypothetical protein
VTTEQGRRAAFWRPVVAVGLILVAAAWTYFAVPFPQEPEDFCPGYGGEERTGHSTSYGLWPPGATDCEYTTPAGEVRHSTYVPWREWLVLALLLSAAALVLWWASAIRTSWFRWLLIAVTAPPTAIVVLVAAWVFPLIVPLLAGVWLVRRRRCRGRG